ncbi:uncharacterized protein LOC129185707 isoform X2 [Dunckerocampus dactyliophorus]|uniref:uncharacterized protein LOC129185707 isoform X2 n=1 Tax=Dunckerocampus dactyliophorus TaxID=161453 RepID=UPI0024064C4C|nr:uncharacterized protein LOC129185707 isoform X2 [Dunckerocampus dactyliophorus]
MNVCHLLVLCIFSALTNTSGGLVIFQRTEGRNFTILWQFLTSGTKYFCKNECKDTDTLVQTNDINSHDGRHSIKYEHTPPAGGTLYVTILNLNMADSGRYRMGVGLPEHPESYRDFEIRVLPAQQYGSSVPRPEVHIHTGPAGGTLEIQCPFHVSRSTKFLCKGNCLDGHILLRTTENSARVGRYGVDFRQEASIKTYLLVVTIAQLDKSDSGRYTCALGPSLRSAYMQEFDVSVTDDLPLNRKVESEGRTDSSENRPTVLVWPLVLAGVLVLLMIAAGLLLLHKHKRKPNSDGPRCEFSAQNPQEEDTYESIQDCGARAPDHSYCTLRPAQHMRCYSNT